MTTIAAYGREEGKEREAATRNTLLAQTDRSYIACRSNVREKKMQYSIDFESNTTLDGISPALLSESNMFTIIFSLLSFFPFFLISFYISPIASSVLPSLAPSRSIPVIMFDCDHASRDRASQRCTSVDNPMSVSAWQQEMYVRWGSSCASNATQCRTWKTSCGWVGHRRRRYAKPAK